MKFRFALLFNFLICVTFLWSCNCEKQVNSTINTPKHHSWLQKPPMGWNSFDAYGSRINEKEFKDHVDFMAEKLLPHGYNYAIIDYIWYHDEPGNWNNPKRRFGHPDLRVDKDGLPLDDMNMDEYGRLLPSPVRFPSTAETKSFKPIADYVHSKGLKFGIHIMRGIPRQAYRDNLPILGTELTARDVAEPWDTCNWMNHMWGVDGTKPGGQEYYNSIFNLYAEWGVDFVKADNMTFPEYHHHDIEMIRKAIDQCGREIIFSVSNGEAPFAYADHLVANTNLWRVSGDFWDYWKALHHNFDLLNAWSGYIGNGTFPDADMIPFGKVSLNNRPHGPERWTKFTRDEQYTLMTLWSIARSPLILGADLYTIDDSTLSIVTNDRIIEVNQHSTNNKQVYSKNGRKVWLADVTGTEDKYVALFNTTEEPLSIFFSFELLNLRNNYRVTDLWTGEDLGIMDKEVRRLLPPHGSAMFKMEKVD
ncbi:MAG: glycoside hydrolase family 27 protein [Bacteroidales bacterium]|nr:glycoside hydrolase family 27 protein [Bacteroidales bacterium]